MGLQIRVSEELNPIMQDVKKGKVRFVNNCFPYHGYMWNYGAFPQVSYRCVRCVYDEVVHPLDLGRSQCHGPQHSG